MVFGRITIHKKIHLMTKFFTSASFEAAINQNDWYSHQLSALIQELSHSCYGLAEMELGIMKRARQKGIKSLSKKQLGVVVMVINRFMGLSCACGETDIPIEDAADALAAGHVCENCRRLKELLEKED